MRQFENEGPRSDGAPVVWAGREDGPALVVVDPAGAARHDALPPTWDQLAGHFQIAWCRVPASRRSLEDVEDVLETMAERLTPVTIVASGESCAVAVTIADQFSDIVTTVLLIDPPDEADADKLSETEIDVRVVARSHAGPTDRVEAPLPLGHPEVVSGLVKALAEIA